MSAKVITPPFCEINCPYLCDLCAYNMKESAIAAANDDPDEGSMFAMYPTKDAGSHKPVIPVFAEVKPKIIKIGKVIFIDPLDDPAPLKMVVGEIVTYPDAA